MTKFKRFLSGTEIDQIVDDFGCGGSCGNLFEIGARLEQAVLAKLAEQEPILYISDKVLNTATGRIDPTAKNALTWSRNSCQSWSVPLYAHPFQINGLADGTLIHEGTKGQHRSIENHIPDAGKMIEHESHSLEFEVRTMVEMLEAKEWAEHCGKSDLGQRLEWAITSLHNEAQIIPDGWQPIETAPRGMVLLFCDASMPEHPVYYAGLVIRNRECIDTTQTIGFMATHWMQMPETPKYMGDSNE